MIKVSGLNKYYNKGKSNELHVINDTTIELPDTGLICILGESGSGKTTLMNTISGLDNFENGTIDVDGTEIKRYGDVGQERVRNEKFGYIFQNYYLLQDRTVEYNLMLALGLYDISDEEKAERIDYVLKAVDMWRYKKRPVSRLSGGQQQRVAIARALAKSPKVIFADEPTGNLDEANTMRIMGVLKKISENCLVVVVTHEKSIADFFADRILWIADGKITDDRVKTERTSYKYVEDTNLYLGEYEKREITGENISVEVYSGEENPDISLKIICDNGKIYISLEDVQNVELLTADSERQVLDGKRPVVELADVEEMDYSLSELTYAKKPKLGLREIKDIALSNIKAMGKRQIFLVLSLFAMSVMMVLAVQDIMAILAVHAEDVVESDSHYLELTITKGSLVSTAESTQAKKKLIRTIKEREDFYEDFVVNPQTALKYTYSGFQQLENVQTSIMNFTFVPLDKLSEKDLYAGSMPKDGYEIVVDRWVLEKYISNSNELSNIISDIRHFIGKKVSTTNNRELTIVGIAETEEMSIYIDGKTIPELSIQMETTMSFSDFKENYAPDYEGEELGLYEAGKYEALVPRAEFFSYYNSYIENVHSRIYDYERELRDVEYVREQMALADDEATIAYFEEQLMYFEQALASAEQRMLEHYGVETYEECVAIRDDYSKYSYDKVVKSGSTYRVTGFFEDELSEKMGTEIVLADTASDMAIPDLIAYMGKCYIYVDDDKDAENIKETIQELAEAQGNVITLTITNPYEDALKVYKEDKAVQFNGRIIVTVTIFVVSMVILYFMMKANAVQRMQDLGVYRLIGISKTSIIGLFAFENMVITSYTSLVGAVICTFATYLVSSIPSLDIRINYPWYAFVLTVLFLYAVNILVGILPIRKILKLPPAQLAAKYDI